MIDSRSEKLTEQFYNWEIRGRGWEYFDHAVDLEPPFIPFFGHYLDEPFVDDGKVPSLLDSIIVFFKNSISPPSIEEKKVQEEETLPPYEFICDEALYHISINFPKERKVKAATFEQFLVMISSSNHPISSEIISNSKKIKFEIVCRESDYFLLNSQLKAFFPDVVVQLNISDPDPILSDSQNAVIVDFGVKEEFMRPCVMSFNTDLDSYISLFGTLNNLEENQSVSIQILFKGVVNPWPGSILRAVMDNAGGNFFKDAPEMTVLAKEKISSPFFSVSIKVLAQADTLEECHGIVHLLSQTISRISNSGNNCLIPLKEKLYEFDTYLEDILDRKSHRLGMLLNSKELLTLMHFPSGSVISSKLHQDTRKSKKAPTIALGHPFILGTNIHQGKQENVTESSIQRLKHTHIIGATGTGKSTLLINMILQDIENNQGIAVLDPHGDLIESILGRMPETRIQDCIVIDPADSEYPVGLNILHAHSEIEKDILSSDLISVFRRLSTSWGDQMNSVFANAILAFLESNTGGTLIDLRRFLIEKSFRDSFLKTVKDPSIVYYWTKEYPLLKSNSVAPILTRLDTFLRPKIIRNMVAQKKGIDFEQIMNSRKILLVKLPQGLIGAENSYLLGTLIVSKIQQTALARQAKGLENRNDFYLYIDEFQYFITPSLASILSGARKYHLGLILAHQDIQQLQKYDTEITNSVISNCGTRICFRLGDFDAKKLEEGFSYFDAKDLQNLSTGQAIARIEKPEFDFSLETNTLGVGNSKIQEIIRKAVIQNSRERHSSRREDIEKIIADTFFTKQDSSPEKPPVPAEPITQQFNESIKQSSIDAETIEIEHKQPIEETVKKEQSQHRYLQTLIKRMAESRGYKASIEQPTNDYSNGRIDVSLEKNRSRIACEISISTSKEWELHNVLKCLSGGYNKVFICSMERKHLEEIKNYLDKEMQTELRSKVQTFLPEELFLHLDQELANESNKEERVKGYRVKVEYNAVTEHEAKTKKASILKTISNSNRKKSK